MTEDLSTDPVTRIAQIAERLRTIAANGLHYNTISYDVERYEQTRALAAELLGLVSVTPAPTITRILNEDIGLRTPVVAADAAIFDDEGRLLVLQRSDSHLWCLPGGAAEVGEPPSAAAVREVREETGLIVRADRVSGVFDNLTWGEPSIALQVYYLVFECAIVGGTLAPTDEALDFRWITATEAAELPAHTSHKFKIPLAFEARAAGVTLFN